MSTPIISATNLSKRYVLGHQRNKDDGFRHLLEDTFRAPLKWLSSSGKTKERTRDEFWAIKNVSFDIMPGDIVGIIGRNGAGKSTLLKLLSRITEPTSGRIQIDGRVASLLEVGTGFHPELSGRENIFLNGAILGMTRQEIKRKFDEIVSFSEVERFLDTPVKRYSSGMYVRLAFAVAAHLEPEVLIVDEVLAVGDAQFQKKCLGKMGEVSRNGRTIIFVSHNMAAISQLTKRCILLQKGQVLADGLTDDCLNRYQSITGGTSETSFDVSKTQRGDRGSRQISFQEFHFERKSPVFQFGNDISFVASLFSDTRISSLRISLTVFATDGTPIGACFADPASEFTAEGFTNIRVTLPNPRLAPGRYHLGVAVGKGNNKTGFVDYDIVLDTLHFEVEQESGDAGTISHWNKAWGEISFPPLVQQQMTRHDKSNVR